jgi:hypothetical protein
LERFIALSIPNKFLLFLQKIRNGFGNLGEVQNKSTIVASQAEKAYAQSLAASNPAPLEPCSDPRIFS